MALSGFGQNSSSTINQQSNQPLCVEITIKSQIHSVVRLDPPQHYNNRNAQGTTSRIHQVYKQPQTLLATPFTCVYIYPMGYVFVALSLYSKLMTTRHHNPAMTTQLDYVPPSLQHTYIIIFLHTIVFDSKNQKTSPG